MNSDKKVSFSWRVLALLAILSLLLVVPGAGASPSAEPNPFKFRIQLTQNAADDIASLGLQVPVTGRVYLILTRDGDSEPREQIDVTGVPFWGVDVSELAAGSTSSWAPANRRRWVILSLASRTFPTAIITCKPS